MTLDQKKIDKLFISALIKYLKRCTRKQIKEVGWMVGIDVRLRKEAENLMRSWDEKEKTMNLKGTTK